MADSSKSSIVTYQRSPGHWARSHHAVFAFRMFIRGVTTVSFGRLGGDRIVLLNLASSGQRTPIAHEFLDIPGHCRIVLRVRMQVVIG